MKEITLVEKPLTVTQLKAIAEQRFGDMVKGVVDIEQKIMALGGELHADEEAFLLQRGSDQKNLWGINLYPDLSMPDMLEFDSMINIRPSQNNPSRSVEDPKIRAKIIDIVLSLISQ
jgi:hypothetical protein